MAVNKEIRVLKTNTLEEFRNKTNDIALHLGDNEQLSAQLADKITTYVDVSAGANVFLTPRFEYKDGESVDNNSGYIILQDLASFTGFANGGTITQSGGYTATIVHATTEKILVKNASGEFDPTEDLSDGSNTIANAKVVRLVTEIYPKGLLRVYKNNVEINQGLAADEFHVLNLAGKIALTGSPDVSDILEGTVLNQTGGFQGTVLRARSNEILFKAVSGTFSTSQVLKFTTTEEGALVGATAVATNKFSGSFITYDTARGNAIELNTPAAANDDIKIFSANLVDALNELQDDIGSVESLTTTATTLQGAINEHDAELGTITSGAMGTTASTVSGAIAEHETQLGDIDFTGIASTISGSLTQLHTEIGNPPSLTTNAKGNLVSAINEIDAVFDASNKSIDSGSAFTVNVTGDFTVDASDDVKLNVDGGDVVLQDDNIEYGRFSNVSGELQLKTGNSSTPFLRGMGTSGNALFANNLTVSNDLIVNNNVDIEGNVDVNGSIETDGLSINGTTVSSTAAELNILDGATLDVNELNILDGVTASTAEINLLDGVTSTTAELNILDGVTASATDINLIDGITNGTVIASKAIITDANKDITGGRNITISGEMQSGSLDVNGVADISGNLTIGSLSTSSQHVRGSLNELHTELGDIAALNNTFTNDSNLVAALNELQTEVGANSYPANEGPASGLGNVTAAINAINSDIGTTSYSGLSSTISGGLAQLHTEVGTLSLDTSASNLTAAINELHGEINTNATNISNNDTDIATINTNIGSLGSLTTSVTNSIVNAINSVEDEVDALQTFQTTTNTNIGTIGNLGTSATSLVTAINELHSEINSNDSDISTLQSGKLNLTDSGTQVLGSNITFGTSGKTMTFASGTTLDLSAATLTLGGGGSTLQFNTAFIELDVDSNQQGIKINRSAITGVGGSAPDAELRWNNGNTKNVGWEVVYPNGADNAGLTTSLVTFDNAGNLVDGSTETGINVTFGSNNFNFEVLVDDSSIEVNSSNKLVVKPLGITANKLASSAVTTGKIASSAVTNAKIANSTIANAKLANSGVTVTDGTNSTVLDLGETLTIQGTNNEIEVVENANTFTVGLPNDVTIAGNLTVNGTTTTINTSELSIEDKTIQIGNNANTLADTNGAGIEFGNNAGKPTLLWDNTNTRLTVNKEFHSSVGFNGVGTNLTALNASNISSGTISDDRLPATITSNITGNVTGDVTGNADTATALATSRNFSITGDITAPTVGFTGTGPVVLNATIDNNTVDVAELNVTGSPSVGKAITYSSSGGLEWSTISFTDTNTTYGVSVQAGAANTSIIRLTGSDSSTDDITLQAGSNITLTESGDTIIIASTQATVNNPQITIGAGALIDVSADNNFTLNQSGAQTIQVDVDLTELTLETADIAGTDHLVYIDNGTQKKIAFSNVNLSAFDNDSGFITNSSASLNANKITAGTLASARLPDLAVSDFAAAAVQTSSESFADNDTSFMTSAAIQDKIQSFGYSTTTGTVSSLSDLSITSTAAEINKLDGFTGDKDDLNYAKDLKATGVTSAEFDFLDGVTSNIQTQLDSKTSNSGDITRVNITAGTGLSGSVNTASGNHTQTIELDHLGIEDLTDPNADRILFFDDSGSAVKFLTPGDNISITDTTLNVANTNVTTNLSHTRTSTAVTIESSDGNNTQIGTATTTQAGFLSASDKTKLNSVEQSATATLQPAISSNGSTPSLTTGISADEVRSLISAGDMTQFTITDPGSTNEVIQQNGTIGLQNGSFINLSLQGSSGSRSIRADLTGLDSIKTLQLLNSSGNNISSVDATVVEDTMKFKEGSNITLTSDGTDTITIASTDTTFTAGEGLALSGTVFRKADDSRITLANASGSGNRHRIGTEEKSNTGTASIAFKQQQVSGEPGIIEFYGSAGGTTTQSIIAKIDGNDGDFTTLGDVTAFASSISSDEKLKENIQRVDNALELVCKLDGVTFDWKDKNRGSSAGVIAQNVENVLPSAVNEIDELSGNDSFKVVDYNQLSALFIESIKELKQQNEELKAEVEKLKSINSNS